MLLVYVALRPGHDDANTLSVHVATSLPFPIFFVINWKKAQPAPELKVNCKEYKPVYGIANLKFDVKDGVQF